ncbi:acyl carrier protein [Flavobacterium sp. ALD4]|jgi:acyl carrier protein|uniref:acyl carrier protein n=1 Tax=Flavobacterium sp. ALD4 TaxID=2058314 RepID=UPI000C34778A|nr:acyl carrier protein [Flavobacterium sp. ALD4]PKH68274.1 acyl carrier protein [Flavobacterium sp. ALD4]|tara:strand:+ start:437 stop:691 length:255 start_codon:yes stop_codon:yes gene_type:complete
MNKEETLVQLRNIIKPYINNEEGFENFTENTDFIADLNINSANLVDIILDVEDHFKIHIDNESMEKMVDVKSTLEIIETKLAER